MKFGPFFYFFFSGNVKRFLLNLWVLAAFLNIIAWVVFGAIHTKKLRDYFWFVQPGVGFEYFNIFYAFYCFKDLPKNLCRFFWNYLSFKFWFNFNISPFSNGPSMRPVVVSQVFSKVCCFSGVSPCKCSWVTPSR